MTLIHVNVSERVYMILSKEAEKLQMSIGQYCAELVTDCAAELNKPPKKEADPE